MTLKRKIKVLVVDDSLIFRETLAKGIGSDPNIEVVATASDPYIARDKILEFEPDVMTLDVEMPKMNGIQFLRKLIPQYPIPVVVVSAVNDNVFEALNAGAVDFVTKPNMNNQNGVDGLIKELIFKIKIASAARIGNNKKIIESSEISEKLTGNLDRIIAIGASTGGTEAIDFLIKSFPKQMPGIVIVQHMPPVFTKMYAERLNNSSNLEVKEAETGDEIIPGRVLIAPGEYHMKIRKGPNGYHVDCIKGEKVNGHCPSVDILFDSVAEVAGKSAIGVILTGMGHDGAKGLLNMRKKGCITLGQDEQSSIVYGMPRVAYDIGAVQYQVPLSSIPHKIFSIIKGKL